MLTRAIGLDIETKSKDPANPQWALEPWRFRDGQVDITSIAIANGQGQSKLIGLDYLPNLKGSRLVTYNGLFDIAFLFAAGVPVHEYKWVDAMLLWKWVDNSQKAERSPSWGLAAAVQRWLSDLPWAQEFIRMKEQGEEARDAAYWERRAGLDAFACLLVAQRAFKELTAQQQRSALIEAECLAPVAASWVRGVPMAINECGAKAPAITQEMEDIESRLGVRVPLGQTWRPSPILRSPQQMGSLLYDAWGLPVDQSMLTPKGARGTNKAALTYLADHSDLVLEILRWRELNTQLSKFIQGPLKAANYLGSHTLHPAPKLFSTYTGRMTYGSKSQRKYPIGMALHQWPRDKAIRDLIRPPPGFALVEFDAAGQERRIIADLSNDRGMIDVFNRQAPFDDLHSFMGASVAGIPFDEFLRLKAQGNKQVTGEHGYRYLGKFLNLSCQYRIGAKKLRIKARVDYGMKLDILKAKERIKRHNALYPGLVQYWKDAIAVARCDGYAETRAGRRFGLTDWYGNEWGTEQSAINHPIQGTGGDMKELAIATITPAFPELIFAFDLHDALFMWCKIEDLSKDLILAARDLLNNLPYADAWGWEPKVPILWDASVGSSWGKMREIA